MPFDLFVENTEQQKGAATLAGRNEALAFPKTEYTDL
jgi:hypothetical protein